MRGVCVCVCVCVCVFVCVCVMLHTVDVEQCVVNTVLRRALCVA